MFPLKISCHIVSWKIADSNSADPSIEIVGRGSGIFSFLLRRIGMSPTVKFSLQDGTLKLLAHSWSGKANYVVPMAKVRSSRFGFVKRWQQALGIFFGSIELGRILSSMGHGTGSFHKFVEHGGIVVPCAVFGAVAAYLHYEFQRKLQFSVTSKSGERFDFSFYPSVIEGVTIDEGQGLRVLQALQSATNPNYKVMENTAA